MKGRGGGASQKAKNINQYEPEVKFPEGWEGGSKQTPYMGGVWIFS